jgi:hypothetical protein
VAEASASTIVVEARATLSWIVEAGRMHRFFMTASILPAGAWALQVTDNTSPPAVEFTAVRCHDNARENGRQSA